MPQQIASAHFPSSSTPLVYGDKVCVFVPVPRTTRYLGTVVATRRHYDFPSTSKKSNNNNYNDGKNQDQTNSSRANRNCYVYVKALLSNVKRVVVVEGEDTVGVDGWVPRTWCVKISTFHASAIRSLIEVHRKGALMLFNSGIAPGGADSLPAYYYSPQRQQDQDLQEDDHHEPHDGCAETSAQQQQQQPQIQQQQQLQQQSPCSATKVPPNSRWSSPSAADLRLLDSEYPVSLIYLGFEIGNLIPTAWPAILQIPAPPPSANVVYSMHLCHRCLRPFAKKSQLASHYVMCNATTLPDSATEVFASPSGNSAVFRIDGAVEPEFALRLAILGRSFISSKDLWDTDVRELEFFVLCCTAERLGLSEMASKKNLTEFNDVVNCAAEQQEGHIPRYPANNDDDDDVNGNHHYCYFDQQFHQYPVLFENGFDPQWKLFASTRQSYMLNCMNTSNDKNNNSSSIGSHSSRRTGTSPSSSTSSSTTSSKKSSGRSARGALSESKDLTNPSTMPENILYFAGYFSRVKRTPNHALCCIMLLPCFQGRALGSLLVKLAYSLDHVRLTECGCEECCGGKTGLPGKTTDPWSYGGKKMLCSFMREKLALGARRILKEQQEEKEKKERKRLKQLSKQQRGAGAGQILPFSSFGLPSCDFGADQGTDTKPCQQQQQQQQQQKQQTDQKLQGMISNRMLLFSSDQQQYLGKLQQQQQVPLDGSSVHTSPSSSPPSSSSSSSSTTTAMTTMTRAISSSLFSNFFSAEEGDTDSDTNGSKAKEDITAPHRRQREEAEGDGNDTEAESKNETEKCRLSQKTKKVPISSETQMVSTGFSDCPLRPYFGTKTAMTWPELSKKLTPSLDPSDAFKLMVADNLVGEIPVRVKYKTTNVYSIGDGGGSNTSDNQNTATVSRDTVTDSDGKLGFVVVPKEFVAKAEKLLERTKFLSTTGVGISLSSLASASSSSSNIWQQQQRQPTTVEDFAFEEHAAIVDPLRAFDHYTIT